MFAGTYTGQVPLPRWVNEVRLMREFGWTEKQLYEEVTVEMIHKISYLLNEEAKATKREFESASRYQHHITPKRSYK